MREALGKENNEIGGKYLDLDNIWVGKEKEIVEDRRVNILRGKKLGLLSDASIGSRIFFKF